MTTPTYPLTARGNRIYDAAGREVAVATRSDPALRGSCDETAGEIVAALNHWRSGGPRCRSCGEPLHCAECGAAAQQESR